MNCPVCKTEILAARQIEDGLPAFHCAKCSGQWVAADAYLAWVTVRENLPEQPYQGRELTINDDQRARLCPHCRAIMLRYQVGHGTSVILDQCGSCNGIWFDQDEWEALKGRNLHDDIHHIFTAPWQDSVRREEASAHLDKIYRQRFGEDYDEALRIRDWLNNHSQRSHLLAFLQDENPYQA